MLILVTAHLLLAGRAAHDSEFRIWLAIGARWNSLLRIYDSRLHRINCDVLRCDVLLGVARYLLYMIDIDIVNPIVVVTHIER